MDLKQRKLNKSEWDSIEIPVSKSELDILNMIVQGYQDVNIKINNNNSIFSFLKIEFSEKMENYLFNKYFRERTDKIEEDIKKLNVQYKCMKIDNDVKINSADKVRLERFDEKTIVVNDIYENILLAHIQKLLINKKNNNIKLFHFHYFTIYKLIRNNISRLNRHIKDITDRILDIFEVDVKLSIIIENSVDFIEKNESMLKYNDLTLYEHQKDIFTACKSPNSKFAR